MAVEYPTPLPSRASPSPYHASPMPVPFASPLAHSPFPAIGSNVLVRLDQQVVPAHVIESNGARGIVRQFQEYRVQGKRSMKKWRKNPAGWRADRAVGIEHIL